jgi:hypothetical protein
MVARRFILIRSLGIAACEHGQTGANMGGVSPTIGPTKSFWASRSVPPCLSTCLRATRNATEGMRCDRLQSAIGHVWRDPLRITRLVPVNWRT